MTIDGERFTSDLIVFPEGRVADNWWRADGHRLTQKDLAMVIAAGPEIIVAGMGIYGRMQAAPGLSERLASKGITLITENTELAAETFNDLCDGIRRVAGCFHLTC